MRRAGARYLKGFRAFRGLHPVGRDIGALTCDWETFQPGSRGGDLRNVNFGSLSLPLYLIPEWTQDRSEVKVPWP